MDLDQAKQLLESQLSMGGSTARNGARMVLLEVSKVHGQAGVDQLIKELGLEEKLGFKPGESLFV